MELNHHYGLRMTLTFNAFGSLRASYCQKMFYACYRYTMTASRKIRNRTWDPLFHIDNPYLSALSRKELNAWTSNWQGPSLQMLCHWAIFRNAPLEGGAFLLFCFQPQAKQLNSSGLTFSTWRKFTWISYWWWGFWAGTRTRVDSHVSLPAPWLLVRITHYHSTQDLKHLVVKERLGQVNETGQSFQKIILFLRP